MKQFMRGFTFVELTIMIAVLATIGTLATVNLAHFNQHATVSSRIATLVSDIRSQQFRAMTGDTDGAATQQEYGVYFEPTQYTLFEGATYDPAKQTNYTVKLENNLSFDAISLPNNEIQFLPISGEVSGYSDTTNTVRLRDGTNGETKTLQINHYGVITAIQ